MWAFMSPTELPCPHCQLNAFLNINLFLFNVVGNKIILKKNNNNKHHLLFILITFHSSLTSTHDVFDCFVIYNV